MRSVTDLTDLTIADAGKLLEQREVSPVELVDAALARIERLNPELHAFITVTANAARAKARDAETRIGKGGYRGGFDGIPFALKDNVETAGIRSTSHSKLLFDNVPTEDATVAANLSSAGGILVGKTATFEFALGGPSWDLPWPPAVNPWSPKHLPGGSSSGSGSAVGGRLVPAAIGTDTGGSVRWPAAVCGIAGLKPTYGRISRRGVHPNTFSLDYCGPMTRTVEDCAIMLSAAAGFDPLDPGSIDEPVPDYRAALTGSIKGLRVGLVRHWYSSDATPEVVSAVDAATIAPSDVSCAMAITAGWLNPAEPNNPKGGDFFKSRARIVTMPFSLSGIPALSVPCGFSADGLPLSLQIGGKPFDEATVLRAGDAYQRSTEWHLRKPPLA